MSAIRLLVTKELDATAEKKLRDAGFEVDMTAFISVSEIHDGDLQEKIKELASGNRTVVFTSANAVTIVDRMLAGMNTKAEWQVFSLEGKTAEAIEAASQIRAQLVGTAASASELANEMRDLPGTIFFFCGDKRRDELPDLLRGKKIMVEEIVVYQTQLTPKIVNQDYDGVLFYSPSAVESFFSINTIAGKTICFAIGNTTANALQRFTKRIHIATAPTKMAELVIETYQSKKAQ